MTHSVLEKESAYDLCSNLFVVLLKDSRFLLEAKTPCRTDHAPFASLFLERGKLFHFYCIIDWISFFMLRIFLAKMLLWLIQSKIES